MADSPSPRPSVAVIGCGLIGKKRLQALRGAADVRYVCDIELARALDAAKATEHAVALDDHTRVLADDAVTAVFVCTLNASLAPLARDAIAAGKHVLVEKPGALNAAQLKALADLAQEKRVQLRIGYNHRFHPALQKARALVDEGQVGPLMFLRARYGHGGRTGYDREWRADASKSGGGELIDQGVHLIDLAQWFLGDLPNVDGHATTSYWDMPVDDNAFLSLRTEAGNTAWLHVSCTEWKNLFSLEIYGRDGKLAIDGLGGSYGVERLAFYKMLPQMGPPETTVYEYPRGDDSWALETKAFLDDIAARADRRGQLAQAVRTLEIVEIIYRSSGYEVSRAGLSPSS